MKRNCLIYNYALHYRYNIFKLLDESNEFDLYFGDKYLDVEKIDYNKLKNFKIELKNKVFLKRPVYYQKGAISLLFKPYENYLLLGESICISTWIILFLAKFMPSKRIILWTHGYYGKESKLRLLSKKIFFGLADKILLYSEYSKDLMLKDGFDNTKLDVIYNSLEYDSHLKLRNEILQSNILVDHYNNSYKNLIFIGRLTKIKNLELLIMAVKTLIDNNQFINLTFVGTGTEYENLSNLTKKLGIVDYVWFYGKEYNEDKISRLLKSADICVSPGNVGLTAIHSLSFGTPVISHNNFKLQMPEFESIIPDVTGDFFEYNNLESLVEIIQKWINIDLSKDTITKECYKIIDEKYNPYYQLNIIKESLK